MAGKSREKQRQPWEVDFIRCELDKLGREAVAKWDVKYETTIDTISKLVEDGYKLSVARDGNRDSVGAWLTSPKREGGPRQRCLGARGPDLLGAIKCLAYKHSIVLDGEWENEQPESLGPGQWG